MRYTAVSYHHPLPTCTLALLQDNKMMIPGVNLKDYHPYVSFNLDLSKFMA